MYCIESLNIADIFKLPLSLAYIYGADMLGALKKNNGVRLQPYTVPPNTLYINIANKKSRLFIIV